MHRVNNNSYDIYYELMKAYRSLPVVPPEEGEELDYVYKGVRMYTICERASLDALPTWEVRPDDVFVMTYPKSGTTWMQHIVLEVMKLTGRVSVNKEVHLSFRFPNLESTWIHHISQAGLVKPGNVVLDEAPSPRLIKTHLPSCMLPEQMLTKAPRIIYVSRNPKDVAVSYYHWHRSAYFLPGYDSWDVFFEEFIRGAVINGCVFDHNLFWWKRRHQANVLFVKYEDMQRDLRSTIARVASFIGESLTEAQVDQVYESSTFSSMKTNPKANLDDSYGNMKAFMRTGKSGGWKSTFTVAQNERFDEICREKLRGTGLTFDFGL
ncbi:sulfotransferase 1A1-like [Patiria miniata]|uniref:Sulfotransferase domain-containing protein n=1 Tax=Patiria miniata TaxID=46514 RepID=A0A914AYI0_PATMI|nr:sulfotransferase 1A1-like [Patiria miniata]